MKEVAGATALMLDASGIICVPESSSKEVHLLAMKLSSWTKVDLGTAWMVKPKRNLMVLGSLY